MPYDSQGNFTRIHNWEDDRVNDIDIVTDHHDEEDNNIAEALNRCFLRDGRSAMSGEINCAGFKIKNIGNGALNSDAASWGQLDKAIKDLKEEIKLSINKSLLIGDIKQSALTKNHNNWLLCDGQAVKRDDYADLFALVGTKFGVGDGVNTFNIPDYRGKFLRGLGGDAAKDIYTVQDEGLPNIKATFGAVRRGWAAEPEPTGAVTRAGTYNARVAGGDGDDWGARYDFDAAKSNEIYGKSEHVTPVNMAVNYFIKAKED